MILTRNFMREFFKSSGLDYSIITGQNIERLRLLVDSEMSESGCISGTFRTRELFDIQKGVYADIKCCSNYFDNRQCLTFEEDGFIGFAGWADDRNIQPILKGFEKWVKGLTDEDA